MRRRMIFILFFAIVLPNSGCISSAYFFNRGEIDKKVATIAVLHFKDFNNAEGNNSGDLARSLFEHNLLKRGFNIIEIEKIQFPESLKIKDRKDFSPEEIIEIGKINGADYVVYGSVYDYKSYQSQTSFLYLFSWLELTYSVGISARMVACKSGDVVWSGSLSRLSYSFNDATSEVCKELIRTIKFK